MFNQSSKQSTTNFCAFLAVAFVWGSLQGCATQAPDGDDNAAEAAVAEKSTNLPGLPPNAGASLESCVEVLPSATSELLQYDLKLTSTDVTLFGRTELQAVSEFDPKPSVTFNQTGVLLSFAPTANRQTLGFRLRAVEGLANTKQPSSLKIAMTARDTAGKTIAVAKKDYRVVRCPEDLKPLLASTSIHSARDNGKPRDKEKEQGGSTLRKVRAYAQIVGSFRCESQRGNTLWGFDYSSGDEKFGSCDSSAAGQCEQVCQQLKKTVGQTQKAECEQQSKARQTECFTPAYVPGYGHGLGGVIRGYMPCQILNPQCEY